MIEKITDIGELSGVSSPLLPLIHSDFHSCINETDGVYIQTVEGEKTLAFSLRNSSMNLVHLSDKWDKDELRSFIKFTHTAYITADFNWSKKCTVYCLMECIPRNFADSAVVAVTPASKMDEYKKIHSLLGDAGDEFGSWYTSFSSKINTRDAVAVYTEGFCSCAVCTAILDSVAIVAGVLTDEQYRGMGYGKRAVQGLLCELYNMKISTTLLWCEEKNITFYENIGFNRKGEIYYREVI